VSFACARLPPPRWGKRTLHRSGGSLGWAAPSSVLAEPGASNRGFVERAWRRSSFDHCLGPDRPATYPERSVGYATRHVPFPPSRGDPNFAKWKDNVEQLLTDVEQGELGPPPGRSVDAIVVFQPGSPTSRSQRAVLREKGPTVRKPPPLEPHGCLTS
jgi:hypothetical protein